VTRVVTALRISPRTAAHGRGAIPPGLHTAAPVRLAATPGLNAFGLLNGSQDGEAVELAAYQHSN
jgi:hypothetical protein